MKWVAKRSPFTAALKRPDGNDEDTKKRRYEAVVTSTAGRPSAGYEAYENRKCKQLAIKCCLHLRFSNASARKRTAVESVSCPAGALGTSREVLFFGSSGLRFFAVNRGYVSGREERTYTFIWRHLPC
jgi:hypothetical protein